MFARMDSEVIDAFFSQEEIETIPKKPLKGKIITPEKTKSCFELFVDDEKSGKHGISVQEKRGEYSVFVSPYFYGE